MSDLTYTSPSSFVVAIAGAIIDESVVFETPASQTLNLDFANSSVSVQLQSPVLFSSDGTNVIISPAD